VSTVDQTAQEFFETLNGFDEIAIAKHFGKKPVELSDTDAMGFARSLIFVSKRREGMKDGDAFEAAMNTTIGEANAYFAEDDDEPDFPVSESGKGDAGDETTPSS
jgi:hypothetical protein